MVESTCASKRTGFAAGSGSSIPAPDCGNRPGPDGLGWADFQDYWVQQGWGPDGTQSFINQLAWYDVGTRQDGYVIGFTIFTAGGFGYWKNYDINPILPQLADYVAGQR